MADTSGSRRVPVSLGTVFRGDWEIVDHVADGGSSSVYRARYVGEFRRHEVPGEAALKVTVPLAPEERIARVREYDTAVRFRAHPTIVTAYEAFPAELEVGRCVVFVHELCGASLAQQLATGPLAAGPVRQLAMDLAGALASLHAAGVVHSDVKPANILQAGDRWKLGDLGAAAQARTATSTSATFVGGTLPYSPPEQASELLGASPPTLTRRDADIWAFGVVLHEAATGRRPFADAVGQVGGVIEIDPALPAEFEPIIRGCLQRDRTLRYADGAALVRALQLLPPVNPSNPADNRTTGGDGLNETSSSRLSSLPPPPPPFSPSGADPSSPGPPDATSMPSDASHDAANVTERRDPSITTQAKRLTGANDRRSRRTVVAAIAGAAALLAAASWSARSDDSPDTAAVTSVAAQVTSPSTMPTTVADASDGSVPSSSDLPDSSNASASSPAPPFSFTSTTGWSSADCELPMVTSTEKQRFIEEIVERFNDAATSAGSCVRASAHAITSGDAATLLVEDWPIDRAGAPRPVLWSPASSAWGELATHRRSRALSITEPTSLMRSPVVIAMPRSVVDRLQIDTTRFGFEQLRRLATDDPGFALVRTYPQSSTAALAGLIDQYYAVGGAQSSATDRRAFNESLESGNTRYRDNTLDVLDDVAAGELRLDAIVLEAKSVADFNRGDPRGALDPSAVAPGVTDPLVPLLPVDGTVVSDHPMYVLDESWVLPNQRVAADDFVRFATSATFAERAIAWGFEPASGSTRLAVPELPMPDGATIEALQTEWSESRKPLRLEVLVDLSGSMLNDDRIGYAKQALLELVDGDLLTARDEIGLRVFTTGLRGEASIVEDLVTPAPFGTVRSELRRAIEELRVVPNGDTPLYRTIELTVAEESAASSSSSRVGAIVVLSDGENDDPGGSPDRRGGDDLVRLLTTFEANKELVRVFTIAYGTDADAAVLEQISQASGARSYDARDVTKIASVLRQAVSNT